MVFSLTLTSACGLTFSGLSPVALPSSLRQLRSVRRSVPSSVFQTLIVSLMLTKLDFGNATLSGLPDIGDRNADFDLKLDL